MAEFSTAAQPLDRLKVIQSAIDYARPVQGETVTADRPWIKSRNPEAGILETRWIQSKPAALKPFAGKWVAILGESVLSSGNSMKAAYDFVKAQGRADALIVKLPPDGVETRHRIANAHANF